MTNTLDILNRYTTITLKEMDNVSLMDRMDTKYVFHKSQLNTLLEDIVKFYRVLEIKGSKVSRYETLYFDTLDYKLYLKHQNQKLNRYKIRIRNYVNSSLIFLEIKFKNNKNRTIKRRIKRSTMDVKFNEEEFDLIKKQTGLNPSELYPQIWVKYNRITLVSVNSNERVTIDTNLSFSKSETSIPFDNLVIVEVKQDRTSVSKIIEVLKKHSIREGSLSKYCFGILNLVEGIKQNNFKKNIRTINKLLYATSKSEIIN